MVISLHGDGEVRTVELADPTLCTFLNFIDHRWENPSPTQGKGRDKNLLRAKFYAYATTTAKLLIYVDLHSHSP